MKQVLSVKSGGWWVSGGREFQEEGAAHAKAGGSKELGHGVLRNRIKTRVMAGTSEAG